MQVEKTHWLSLDPRKEILYLFFSEMENSINLLKKKNRANEYYDGLFLLEESEMIIGYCFIALQNYINANIAELNLDRNRKHEYYDDHKR